MCFDVGRWGSDAQMANDALALRARGDLLLPTELRRRRLPERIGDVCRMIDRSDLCSFSWRSADVGLFILRSASSHASRPDKLYDRAKPTVDFTVMFAGAGPGDSLFASARARTFHDRLLFMLILREFVPIVDFRVTAAGPGLVLCGALAKRLPCPNPMERSVRSVLLTLYIDPGLRAATRAPARCDAILAPDEDRFGLGEERFVLKGCFRRLLGCRYEAQLALMCLSIGCNTLYSAEAA